MLSTFKMAVRIFAVVLAVAVSASAFLIPKDIEARNTRLINGIKSQGYPAELHTLTTSDGYTLNLHRIPHGKTGAPGRRPAVLLMHGLMSTSSHFLILGSQYALGYNLADAGYDVWMGNQRGNYYSRGHASLNPDDSEEKMEFFDYSWEEIGMIDLPTMVDYIIAQTGEEKLHYIGHSQGGTAFLVLVSMNPEYNEKIASAHLLAAVGFKDHFPFNPLKSVADMTSVLYTLGRRMGIVEISYDIISVPRQQEIQEHGVTDYCAGDGVYRAYCETIGLNYLMADIQAIPNIDKLTPDFGGASLKQIAHFGQNIRDAAFRRWDHGLITNRRVYGSFRPPAYDISKITINLTMHYTVGDIILGEEDVLAMAAAMPNAYVRKVEDDSFLHTGFLFSRKTKELVNDYIIEALNASA